MPKLIVILGPTACGKSGLGVTLAKQFHGEIVSADSRQVYRGLDLGTGKITAEEMEGVPHHMLDVAEPGRLYSAADFQRGAYAAIDGILARGRGRCVGQNPGAEYRECDRSVRSIGYRL